MIRLGKLRCSFCRKDETEVLKLVAGPRVYICDACVNIAAQLMNDSPVDSQVRGPKTSAWRKLLDRIGHFIGGGTTRNSTHVVIH